MYHGPAYCFSSPNRPKCPPAPALPAPAAKARPEHGKISSFLLHLFKSRFDKKHSGKLLRNLFCCQKGLGLGASLFRDAIQNAMKVASLAGARALVVDPTGPDAAAFYEHFGFTKLPGTSRMVLKLG